MTCLWSETLNQSVSVFGSEESTTTWGFSTLPILKPTALLIQLKYSQPPVSLHSSYVSFLSPNNKHLHQAALWLNHFREILVFAKSKISAPALSGWIGCKDKKKKKIGPYFCCRTEAVTPKASFQSKPLKHSAGTFSFFLLKHIHTLLHAVLVLQTMLEVSKTKLIMMPQQRPRSFYFMWHFLVKLAKYMNPSRRNALSHSGLCFCVSIICNSLLLTLGLST